MVEALSLENRSNAPAVGWPRPLEIAAPKHQCGQRCPNSDPRLGLARGGRLRRDTWKPMYRVGLSPNAAQRDLEGDLEGRRSAGGPEYRALCLRLAGGPWGDQGGKGVQLCLEEGMKVFTDGSCIGNPGPGGWAWHSPTTGKEASGFEGHTTNNRMELQAIYEAVKALEDGRTVNVLSDSQWSVKVLRREWKAKKNRDLIEAIWALPHWQAVRLYWVRGHAGLEGNEKADRLAQAAANRVAA